MSRSVLPVAAALLVLAACDKTEEATEPAWFGEADIPWRADGVPTVASAEIGFTSTPQVERPNLGPCPSGWTASEGGTFTVCSPWGESGRQDCADGQVHRPGTAGCVAFGDACPEDGWPADLPDSGVAYVRPGAAGTGTKEDPFGTIQDALASGAPVVALSEGLHTAGVTSTRPVTVVGACAAKTQLTYAGLCEDTSVLSFTASATLRDVAIVDSTCAGINIDGATVTVQDVAIYDSDWHGIYNDGGTLTVERVSMERLGGYGVASMGASTLVVRDAMLVEPSGAGVVLADGADAAVVDLTVVNPIPLEGNGLKGMALFSRESTVHVERPVIDSPRFGIVVSGGSATVEGGAALGVPRSYSSVYVADGAEADVSRYWTSGPGISTSANGATVRIQDVVSKDGTTFAGDPASSFEGSRIASDFGAGPVFATQGVADVTDLYCKVGSCINAAAGSQVTVRRSMLGRTNILAGSHVTLEDSFVSGVHDAATVTLHRSRLTGPVSSSGDVVLEDVRITVRDEGPALVVRGAGTVEATRVSFDSMSTPALVHLDGASANLTDVTLIGGGLYAAGGETTVERMVVSEAVELGAGSSLGATLHLTDVAIVERSDETCEGCTRTGLFAGGVTSLTRVLVDGGEPDALISGGHVTCEDVAVVGDAVLQSAGRLSGSRCELVLSDTSGWPTPTQFNQE